jgi:hypothetical protein
MYYIYMLQVEPERKSGRPPNSTDGLVRVSYTVENDIKYNKIENASAYFGYEG